MILAIDPSINNIGIATLQLNNMKWKASTYQTDRENSVTFNCQALMGHIKCVHGKEFVSVVLEYPTFRGDAKGILAAKQGYTIDLAYVVGVIVGSLNLSPLNVHLYTPQQWKGTKPKSATQAAYKRWFWNNHPHLRKIDEHAIDALMMLHYHSTKLGLI